MKKSLIFLINGLGIEKAGSYSISIDQCMPKLARTKETSFFTTAVINSIEYRSAYEQFFLGDTYKLEINYIKEKIINDNINQNSTYLNLVEKLKAPNCKLHVFLEPTNDKIVEQINSLVSKLPLDNDKKVFLHLLLSQQTINEYNKLINTVNYIKYHINSHINLGFIIGKELFHDEMSKDEMDVAKKLFFFCSAERWSETDKKLLSLKEDNIRPCDAPGFCAVNDCNICNGDVILFFNSKSANYDKFINAIYNNAESAFSTDKFSLPLYSLIKLDTKYDVPFFSENIIYDNSLANIMEKSKKKTLIITSEKNVNLINFLVNGLKYVSNPNIQFIKLEDNYLNSKENLIKIIDKSDFELIIIDYHMDVSKTINDLKEQLRKIDDVLGNVAEICANKHSLFITSLYGLRKTLPLADYNEELVTLDYEMQIPIFFFDYTYPRSKYYLLPGETNDILSSAIRNMWDSDDLNTLIRPKGFVNNLRSLFKK